MSESEDQRTEETAEQESPARETDAPDENVEAAGEAEENKEAPVIWSQKRVPNIEKGYNPSVPFYMMGILVGLIILSVIFAKITS